MSSTPRTHSNDLSLDDQLLYKQAVDRKAKQLMPSTDNEIKQTSVDTAKLLSHESKEVVIEQYPYVEFIKKFKSWRNSRTSDRGESEVKNFIDMFDNLSGLPLLKGDYESVTLDGIVFSFILRNTWSFSENLQLKIISMLLSYEGEVDYKKDINTTLGMMLYSTNSKKVIAKIKSLESFSIEKFKTDNRFKTLRNLRKTIIELRDT